MFEESQDKTLEQLLNAFAAARAKNLATLDSFNITTEKLSLPGLHPSLDAVTLGNLLFT